MFLANIAVLLVPSQALVVPQRIKNIETKIRRNLVKKIKTRSVVKTNTALVQAETRNGTARTNIDRTNTVVPAPAKIRIGIAQIRKINIKKRIGTRKNQEKKKRNWKRKLRQVSKTVIYFPYHGYHLFL